MFDRTIVNLPHKLHVDVREDRHEHRAPTDESVRLLKEMERAARDKIVAALSLDNNTFKAVLHAERMVESGRIYWRIIFDLNGKRIDVAHDFSDHVTGEEGGLDTQIKAFIEKVGARIAAIIITPGIQSLAGRSGFSGFLRATKPPNNGGNNGQGA